MTVSNGGNLALKMFLVYDFEPRLILSRTVRREDANAKT
jgi:hypothetical protein